MELKDDLNNYRIMRDILSTLLSGNPVGFIYADGLVIFGANSSAKVAKYVYRNSARKFRKEIIEKVSELLLDELNKTTEDKFRKRKVRGSWFVYWNKDKVYFLINAGRFRDYFEPQYFVFYEIDKEQANKVLNSYRVKLEEVVTDVE